jgi:hypothetical protein
MSPRIKREVVGYPLTLEWHRQLANRSLNHSIPRPRICSESAAASVTHPPTPITKRSPASCRIYILHGNRAECTVTSIHSPSRPTSSTSILLSPIPPEHCSCRNPPSSPPARNTASPEISSAGSERLRESDGWDAMVCGNSARDMAEPDGPGSRGETRRDVRTICF